ncbi:hypothetical protein PM082_020839 [Marasmius tenuissimus]|nr:hypothetical protein PM082_020839 [Marasmius tenuissimus]
MSQGEFRSKRRAEDIVVQFDREVSPIQASYMTPAKRLYEDIVVRSDSLDHDQTEPQWAKDRMMVLKGREREDPYEFGGSRYCVACCTRRYTKIRFYCMRSR